MIMNWVRPVKSWFNIGSSGDVAVLNQDLDRFAMPGMLSCIAMSLDLLVFMHLDHVSYIRS